MYVYSFIKKVLYRIIPPVVEKEGQRGATELRHLSFLADVNLRSRSLYAIGRPSVVCLSVVCLSVTLVHPTQAVELFGNFFHHTIAQGLYFSGAKNRWWGTPFPLKFAFKVTHPPFKQRNFDQYRLIAPQP